MLTLILSLILLACVLLILVILAQNSKGGGLSSQFGGSGASNMIGVKKTGDLLERLTWGFIIAIFVLSIGTNLITTKGGSSTDQFIDRAQEQQGGGTPALDLGGVEEESTTEGEEGEAVDLGDLESEDSEGGE
ncbi:preprotein translocase subunit SecG [Fulvivirga lutea]|uniref:Protein-export membrane protein SecG n=1 Tax=Fulvivirga lutea TaxID=2810512 RepID=A0A974WJX9_9BACT|nr:preprotein translocase subunit SecG [Fulvivirga lutea]QSE96738.1 preprotein translocase subunit SecG [Fulvivirga lutea]